MITKINLPRAFTSRYPLKCRSERGFALIATISIMALLVMVALGMLSLSKIELRSSQNSKAMAEAQANARMALMIAIGELQKQMGPDQRISANADILSVNDSGADVTVVNPHWAGVWDSWVAGPLPDSVNDNYPSTESHHQTIGDQPDDSMRPAYAQKNLHFRQWLVSLLDSDIDSSDPQNTPINLTLEGERMPNFDPAEPAAIQLVGEGSLGTDSLPQDYVSARLLDVQSGVVGSLPTGRYGWWVGDESQKARIMDDSYNTRPAANMAEKITSSQAPASTGTKTIPGLENISDDSQLDALPSLTTLDLVENITDRPAQKNFNDVTTTSYGVLADVREGGLKRDLSNILEREINPNEVFTYTNVNEFKRAISISPNGDDFMLYRFDSMASSMMGAPTGQACVPLQDLAAYYQLYDHSRAGGKGGIQYTSQDSTPATSLLTGGVMVSNPNLGETRGDYDKYLRQYTALYRNPVPIKFEYVVGYYAEEILPRPRPNRTNPPDTHRLRVSLTPSITYWNPNNVPVVMNLGNPDRASVMFREYPMPLSIEFSKSASAGGPVKGTPVTKQFNQLTNTQQGELYTIFVAGSNPTTFEPGETKVFSLAYSSNSSVGAANDVDLAVRGRVGGRYSEPYVAELELLPGWNPEKIIKPSNNQGGSGRTHNDLITFKIGDYISAKIDVGSSKSFGYDFVQKSRHGRNAPGVMWHYRSGGFRGRYIRGNGAGGAAFIRDLVYPGFPGGVGVASKTARQINIAPRRASILIAAMRDSADGYDDIPQPFFYYGVKAAAETHESQNNFPVLGGAGRRFPSRPFTHSTPMAPAYMDSTDEQSLYDYGWNWFFMPLDNMLDAPVSISRDDYGYYGGGYTAENGTTHVVQQHLPVTPPLSIASLSNAHLGGFSLATEPPAEGYSGLRSPWLYESFHRITALGYDGLAPHTLQAIGNSYAHPRILADKAWTIWTRHFKDTGSMSNDDEPFVDHSYLANKALWDDFFFSSISPQPSSVEVFETSTSLDAHTVARNFFLNETPLPNRRLVPYKFGFEEADLDSLYSPTNASLFRDGLADKISAHLMIEGPFNINSTSKTAWKALFSSLKGKTVSYLDQNTALSGSLQVDEEATTGVPVAGGSLPNGKPYTGSPSDPSDPEQWSGWRELTDDEIDKLAEAMVKQVKLRGPFLSLSEFVNRRLDPSDKDLSLKGALQAALDDPTVPINEGFRNATRSFSNAEASYVGAVFPEAMDGPVAYGSSAYVDQADILRNFAAQLTPRGDTFVIRTYGDSLDTKGNVEARAWCEAVIQRVPDYVDSSATTGDEAYKKQSDLSSETNKTYGRQFKIISFRWLNQSEV